MFSTMYRRPFGTVILSAALAAALAAAGPARAQSIAVHWAGYYNNTSSPVTGTDGVVPNSHWTNLAAGWYSIPPGNYSTLVDSNGLATPAAVTDTVAGGGTYWGYYFGANPTENLLKGPGGGGPNGIGPSSAIPNVITGIPYANYEIIAYANNGFLSGPLQMWLDPNPAAPNPSDVPATSYYFSPTVATTNDFEQITNTDPALSPQGNYVIFSGLTGPDQTIWLNGYGAGAPMNYGETGFEIVSTPSPEPSTVALLAAGAVGLAGLVCRRRRAA
jgi:hypothetical protein